MRMAFLRLFAGWLRWERGIGRVSGIGCAEDWPQTTVLAAVPPQCATADGKLLARRLRAVHRAPAAGPQAGVTRLAPFSRSSRASLTQSTPSPAFPHPPHHLRRYRPS